MNEKDKNYQKLIAMDDTRNNCVNKISMNHIGFR